MGPRDSQIPVPLTLGALGCASTPRKDAGLGRALSGRAGEEGDERVRTDLENTAVIRGLEADEPWGTQVDLGVRRVAEEGRFYNHWSSSDSEPCSLLNVSHPSLRLAH